MEMREQGLLPATKRCHLGNSGLTASCSPNIRRRTPNSRVVCPPVWLWLAESALHWGLVALRVPGGPGPLVLAHVEHVELGLPAQLLRGEKVRGGQAGRHGQRKAKRGQGTESGGEMTSNEG